MTMLLLGLVYLGLGNYYKDSFSYGTRINGIYCTGHTPDEVDSMLNEKYNYDGLRIVTEDETILIEPSDIDFTYDFKAALSIYLHNQNSWAWPLNLITDRNRTLKPIVGYDIKKLDAILDSHPVFNYDVEPEVRIVASDGSYELYDSTKHRPDSSLMRQMVSAAIYDSEEELILDDSYYTDLDYSADQRRTIEEYEDVSRMLGAHITYVMGEDRVELTDDILVSFLMRDDNGQLVNASASEQDAETDANAAAGPYVWSPEAIDTWVDVLCDEYDTLGATRTFNATGGYTVSVSGGTYGNQIDRTAEKEYLKNAILNKITEEHEPVYTKKALYQGGDDIGTTYVEVNMTDQKLYYYVDGELVIDTPVVTGNVGRHMDTPSGTNFVYYKQRNRTLIGPNYQTFVNYWIAVNGHIGIHDATWRKEFGGDIYLTDGSHGCINTPMEEVSRLYDMIEIGTPVVMYYTE